MDEKTKELAAIAASVACHCRECLRYHLKKASEVGISKEEADEAIDLGGRISEVSNKRMREFAGDAEGHRS